MDKKITDVILQWAQLDSKYCYFDSILKAQEVSRFWDLNEFYSILNKL
jgi:hypothetical protein